MVYVRKGNKIKCETNPMRLDHLLPRRLKIVKKRKDVNNTVHQKSYAFRHYSFYSR